MEYATAEWVAWYNHQRLHGALGHVPPAEYEAAYWTVANTGEPIPQPALQNN
ncbi:integrase core domain-containing protein [Gordonia alkaliphila]|uniref:Integrase catalytic domain-containing protein n=1 Tax=Gordonia alkaliphila TaxID=1053547 RepID=A0ABP8Z0X7_9ACTN